MSNPNNPAFTRWVRASIGDHFFSLDGHVHVEGANRHTADKDSWYEVRVPRVKTLQRTRSNWTIMIDVDVACCRIHETNAYAVDDMAGAVHSLMSLCIPFYQYDETLTDPIVALPPMCRENDPMISPLGEVKPDLKLYQTNVTSSYKVLI